VKKKRESERKHGINSEGESESESENKNESESKSNRMSDNESESDKEKEKEKDRKMMSKREKVKNGILYIKCMHAGKICIDIYIIHMYKHVYIHVPLYV